MFNKISSRIVLAWIVLGLAMILLTLSVSFAQSVSVTRKDNDEVKFKYKSTDKKNSQEIDTTFTAKTDEEFYSIMQGISDRNNLDLSMLKKDDLNDLDEMSYNSKHSFSYNFNVTTDDGKCSKSHSKHSKGDHADIHIEMNNSMRELEAEMKALEASLSNMKFDMDVNDDDNTMDIRIHNELNIPDSLDNEDHVIVFGDKGEKAPELEKVITNENGRQVFIYKRKK